MISEPKRAPIVAKYERTIPRVLGVVAIAGTLQVLTLVIMLATGGST